VLLFQSRAQGAAIFKAVRRALFMKALWTGVAFVALVMACSGGTDPVTVVDPGPSADETPSLGGGTRPKGTTGGTSGDVCEQAVQKLEDECGLTVGGEPPDCTDDADECIAGCVLDWSCEDLMDKDGGFYDCVADCPH
jgi:hypothetical protein